MTWNRIYMMPDGEAGGASAVPPAQATSEGEAIVAGQQPQYDRPKYFSQIAPARADSEDYKALYKYQKLDELADAAIALQKENDNLKDSSKRSIVVPDGKNPDEVAEFARKLGIPDSADGYTLKGLDADMLPADALKSIRDTCHKAMMTDKQANAVGKILLDITRQGLEMQKKAFEDKRDGFGEALKGSYIELEADVDKESSASRDLGAFKSFAEETGLKEYFDDHGLSYEPSFVRGVAAYARKHAGQVQVQTVPDKPKAESRNTVYGKSFMDRYGRK